MRLPDGLYELIPFSANAFYEHSQALSPPCGKGHFIATPATLLPKVLKRLNVFIAEPSVPVRVLKIFDGAGWRMTAKIGIVVYSYLCVAFHDNLLIIIKWFFLFFHYIFNALSMPKRADTQKTSLFVKYLKIQEG
jgi:hypothetical protein